MALYEYAPTSGHCDKGNGRFEVMQRLADAKLTTCPTRAQRFERRISAVALGGIYAVTDDRIENSGLTQYKKAGDGVYERTAGTNGPEHLFRR